MKELSIFVDESGDQEGQSKYYALTVVFHDQADSKEATRTDERFFGSARAFKNNYLKAIKRKRLAA